MKNVTNIILRRSLAVVAMSCCISHAAYADVIDFKNSTLGTIIDSEYAPLLTVSAFNGSSSPYLGGLFGTTDSNQFNNYNHGKSTKKIWAKGLMKGFKKGWGKGFKKGVSSKIKLFDKDDYEKDDHELLPNIFTTGGDNMWTHPLFGAHGVKHIELKKHGSGAIHHIDFTPAEIPQVPVPAALWLFGSGLIGLVGFARRKKVQLLNT